MLAKLIVWGQDRDATIQRMARALSEYVVLGVRTNIGFLIRLMDDKDFFAGKLDTGFIEKHKKLLQVPKASKELALISSVIIMHTFNGIQKKDKDSNLKSWKHAARASSLSRSSIF